MSTPLPPLPQLVLTRVEPGAAVVAPAGLQPGDALPISPQVLGRWITLGAAPDQDLVLRDQPASIGRSHCRMIYRDGAFQLQGRLRAPGFALNGERFNDCTPRPLTEGDEVTIGAHLTFRFQLSTAP
jgi:predicted component of type VI protein secretion system